ncbi:MAG TPA: PEP-CTERM sorting domain-containing protein [Isosphaeraceae bacterium]|jgi:MYXO-CTERM domain-containing protein
MDRRRVAKWAAAFALGGAIGSNARAGAVTLTGNVGTDFPGGTTTGSAIVAGEQPSSVAQSPWITQSGWVNGWVVKDMQFNYNQAADTMQVGVAFYSIAGDPSGNPSGSDPRVAAAGGSAPPSLGGRDSITVEFAPPSTTNGNLPGAPLIVAGVPENKSASYTGTDGFTVATAGANAAIQTAYGTQISNAMGNLAFDPSPAHPDFEFTIKNWSQFQNLNGSGGFWVSAYAGSPDDAVAGESHIAWSHIGKLTPSQQVINPPPPPPTPPPTVPEPTTVAGWGLMVAGAAWALRRKRMAADQG